MKTLIAYYTKTGNTRAVAEQIAQACGGEMEEVVEVGVSRDGLIGWLRAGRAGMKRETSPIETPKKTPADYDLLVVGSPVWGGNLVPAIRSYLSGLGAGPRAAAFFCTMGSGGDKKTLTSMRELTPFARTVGELAVRQRELADPKALRARVERWVDEVRRAAAEA